VVVVTEVEDEVAVAEVAEEVEEAVLVVAPLIKPSAAVALLPLLERKRHLTKLNFLT
jgi:hypothetical protein